jgi:hypothetical protein
LSFAHSSAQACIFSRGAGGNRGGGTEVSGGGGTGKRVFGGAPWACPLSSRGSRGAAGVLAFFFFFASSRGFTAAGLPETGVADVVGAASAFPLSAAASVKIKNARNTHDRGEDG